MIGFMSTSLNVVKIALSFFTATRRSAILRRNIDIFSRLWLRDPPQTFAASVENPADIASMTSCLVMRPSLPLAFTWFADTLFSFIIFAAAGEADPAAYESDLMGSGFGAAVAFSSFTGAAAGVASAGFAAATGALPAGFAADVSIKHTTCPTFTTSPSAAFNVMIPLSSAGSSSVALSESTSAIAWSFST